LATFEQAMMNTTAAAARSTSNTGRAGAAIWSRRPVTLTRMSARGGYSSGCSCMMLVWRAVSSALASSSVAPGFRRPNNCVMRCVRIVFIVAPRWCGLVTMLAMISVSAGYGTDGSSTPITVALRDPS
jgi:hypothetical protein